VAPDADGRRHSRPATDEDVRRLVRALNEAGADYLLIGGYALLALGYRRFTTDIDVLLPPDRATGERVRRALLVLPDRSAEALDPAWFESGDTIRVADEIVVDLMFNAGGESYASLKAHAVTLELDGVPVRTVDLAGLLKTKARSDRPKDIADRQLLERALRGG
jgi:predicted nucleotidyltransferase